MIKTESAYKKALLKLREDQVFIQNEKERFKELGLTDEQVKIAIEPQISFHEQLKEEVEYYEKIKRGEFEPIINFTNIGKTLIAYRIYIGMSQQELANLMGVPNSQVSRDEKNEYYGATKERLQEVMEAMGMKTITTIEVAS